MWLTILSDQLSITGLVGRYLTNYLMDREPILKRQVLADPHLSSQEYAIPGLHAVLPAFRALSPTRGQVAHVLLTRSPRYRSPRRETFAFD